MIICHRVTGIPDLKRRYVPVFEKKNNRLDKRPVISILFKFKNKLLKIMINILAVSMYLFIYFLLTFNSKNQKFELQGLDLMLLGILS